MQIVKNNDFVTVTYEAFLSDGEKFESSNDSGPLEFQVGGNSVLPGFEKGVIGMQLNETKTFEIKPEDGFGTKRPELVHTVSRDEIGAKGELKPGTVLGLTMEKDGQNIKVPALITEVTSENITVDFNHPLAGQTLKYQVTVTGISDQAMQPSSNGCGCGCDSTQSDCSGSESSGCNC